MTRGSLSAAMCVCVYFSVPTPIVVPPLLVRSTSGGDR
jgi:hypothetical protein